MRAPLSNPHVSVCRDIHILCMITWTVTAWRRAAQHRCHRCRDRMRLGRRTRLSHALPVAGVAAGDALTIAPARTEMHERGLIGGDPGAGARAILICGRAAPAHGQVVAWLGTIA